MRKTWLGRWCRRHFQFTEAVVVRMLAERNDPWQFDTSIYEQQRFARMLQLVRTVPHARVLEVGCAEGHFTEQLVSVAEHVTAIDVSSEAITRASRRVPAATMRQVRLEDLAPPHVPYDVVVCGEMLYYTRCTPCAVRKLMRLGRYLVTSHCNQFALLTDRHLRRYQRLQYQLHIGVRERRFATVCLWDMHAS